MDAIFGKKKRCPNRIAIDGNGVGRRNRKWEDEGDWGEKGKRRRRFLQGAGRMCVVPLERSIDGEAHGVEHWHGGFIGQAVLQVQRGPK